SKSERASSILPKRRLTPAVSHRAIRLQDRPPGERRHRDRRRMAAANSLPIELGRLVPGLRFVTCQLQKLTWYQVLRIANRKPGTREYHLRICSQSGSLEMRAKRPYTW